MRILSEQDFQRLGRIVHAVEHSRPTQAYRARGRRVSAGRGGSSIQLFLLTNVSYDPMMGTHKIWDGSSWVNGGQGWLVPIRPHPASKLENYQTSYVWAIRQGSTWWALEIGNVPSKICIG